MIVKFIRFDLYVSNDLRWEPNFNWLNRVTLSHFEQLALCRGTDWQDLQAEAVIFGVPHGKPYLADQFPNDQSTAPAALRKASPRILLDGQSLDADFQRAVCLDDFKIVDGGDIPLEGGDVQQHYNAAENAVPRRL